MDPPPAPPSGRFRLRIRIIDEKDAANLAAVPLRTFTIAKNDLLPLADLTLKELCNEVIKRYQQLYPGVPLFAVDTTQDSSGSDLWFGEHVRDIFEDNDIFRVIKGAPTRASIDPHRSRSLSIQTGIDSPKRRLRSTFCDPSSNINNRIYNIDPDQPIYSRELISETRSIGSQSQNHALVSSKYSIIPDSQQTTLAHTKAQGTGMNAGLETISSAGDIIAESEYGQNRAESIHKAAESVRNSPELGNPPKNYNMSNSYLFDEMDRVEAENLQNPSVAANRTLYHELEMYNPDSELESNSPQNSSKRKFSQYDNGKVHERQSSNSITSNAQQDNISGVKRLKRVNTNVRAKTTSRKNVYDDFESDTELRVGPKTGLIRSSNGIGPIVHPATSLPKLKLSIQSHTPSNWNSSPMGNINSSRAESSESLLKSFRSSPADEAERLRRAREAQRTALEKQRQRQSLEREHAKEALGKEQAKEVIRKQRERKAAKHREDEENALNEYESQELERERETMRLETRARERREKAFLDRILAKREQAKLQFEVDKKRTIKEKELQQERLAAGQEKIRLLTEAANSRTIDIGKERKVAAADKQRREKHEAERKVTEAKEKERKDAKLIAERETQGSNANAAEEREKKLMEERARQSAEHVAKQNDFRTTQAKLVEVKEDAEAKALHEAEDRRKPKAVVALKRHEEGIVGFEAQTDKHVRKRLSNSFNASMRRSVDSQRQTKTQETSTFTNPTPPSSAGDMLARAVQRFHDASQDSEIDRLDIDPEGSQNDAPLPCTQQRRAGGLLSVSQTSSQAITSQSPEVHSVAGLKVNTQMPHTDSLNQTESFSDSPKAYKPAGHLKKKLIQTTLIPDCPNVSQVKTAVAGQRSSKQVAASKIWKGKEKVVESPGSPPNPILISSNESSSYSDVNSDELNISLDRTPEGRLDGPSYQVARNSSRLKSNHSALPTSPTVTNGEDRSKLVNHHTTISKYTASPPVETTSSQINPGTQEVLRRIANIGFPTPAYVAPQFDMGPRSQIGSWATRFSLQNDDSKLLDGTAASSDLSFKRERDIKLPTHRSVKNPDPEKTSQFRKSLRDMYTKSWTSPEESRTRVSQQQASNLSQATSTDIITSRPSVFKTQSPVETPPEIPTENNCAPDDTSEPENTQSELDKQLLLQNQESSDRNSSPELTDSSSNSSGVPPSSVQVRGSLSQMTKDLFVQVAAKKAHESSESVLRNKRELDGKLMKEKEEAAAALEMSSTDTESSSDDESSEDSRDEDDPIAQGNLYNGTGFRKRANIGNVGVRKELLTSNTDTSRRGRKYQKNIKTGKMVKVGKYESIDTKTGKVVDDSRRWLAKFKRNIRT